MWRKTKFKFKYLFWMAVNPLILWYICGAGISPLLNGGIPEAPWYANRWTLAPHAVTWRARVSRGIWLRMAVDSAPLGNDGGADFIIVETPRVVIWARLAPYATTWLALVARGVRPWVAISSFAFRNVNVTILTPWWRCKNCKKELPVKINP